MKHLILFCCFASCFSFGQQLSPEHFLSELVQVESYSGCEVEVARTIHDWAQQQGFYTTDFGIGEDAKNILVSLYPLSSGKPNIVFTSHLDIVPAEYNEYWREAPFSGKIIQDTVWGRGSIDCKGLAVMQLFAMKKFKDSLQNKEFPYNISFLGLAEEEAESIHGASMISKKFMDEIRTVVIFGEGGSGLRDVLLSKPEIPIFGVSVADKSSLWLKLEAQGGGFGHGAVPSDLYANKRLIKALIRLLDEKKSVRFNQLVMQMFRDMGELEGGTRGFVLKHINWAIFWPFVKKHFREGEPFNVLLDNTFSITHIESSATVSNQMSERASAILDCRLLPGTDIDQFIKKMKRTVGSRVNIEILYQSPAALPSPVTPYFDNMAKAIKIVHPDAETIPILFPATTDNNFFRNLEIPVYGIIPSILNTELFETIHSVNERIGVNNLYKGIEVYFQFLKLNVREILK